MQSVLTRHVEPETVASSAGAAGWRHDVRALSWRLSPYGCNAQALQVLQHKHQEEAIRDLHAGSITCMHSHRHVPYLVLCPHSILPTRHAASDSIALHESTTAVSLTSLAAYYPFSRARPVPVSIRGPVNRLLAALCSAAAKGVCTNRATTTRRRQHL
jgi:hypothetical protein